MLLLVNHMHVVSTCRQSEFDSENIMLSHLTYLFDLNSNRSIGVFAWGDSGTVRLVKGQ